MYFLTLRSSHDRSDGQPQPFFLVLRSLAVLLYEQSLVVAVGVLATAASSRVTCYNKNYATAAVGEFSLPENSH